MTQRCIPPCTQRRAANNKEKCFGSFFIFWNHFSRTSTWFVCQTCHYVHAHQTNNKMCVRVWKRCRFKNIAFRENRLYRICMPQSMPHRVCRNKRFPRIDVTARRTKSSPLPASCHTRISTSNQSFYVLFFLSISDLPQTMEMESAHAIHTLHKAKK